MSPSMAQKLARFAELGEDGREVRGDAGGSSARWGGHRGILRNPGSLFSFLFMLLGSVSPVLWAEGDWVRWWVSTHSSGIEVLRRPLRPLV